MSRRMTTLTSIATAALLATTMGTAGAQATDTACGNAPAGYNVIESNARFVIGTTGPDFICAGDGNNIIRAKGKDDIIYGGGGNDVIWGGFGNDTIFGGDGNDLIRAGDGKDTVWGEAGNDSILAGNGPDTVRGGEGDDKLTGGEGHDLMRGDAGADKLIGNKGIDRLFGDAGNDVLQGGIGVDTIAGGADNDNIVGGDHDDVLTGGAGNDRILGGNGADTMSGGDGDDTLLGGGNPDILRGNNGDDFIDGGNGLNSAQGGEGADSCNNVDAPISVCEFVDGIELAARTARITATFPLTGPVEISGTEWTQSASVDFQILPAGVANGDSFETLATNANGDWSISVTAAELGDGTIQTVDRNAGRIKTFAPVLESAMFDPATTELTVSGELNSAVEAFVYSNGVLVFVEQMSFEDGVSRTVDFLELDVAITAIDIQSSDVDGDKAIHRIFTA